MRKKRKLSNALCKAMKVLVPPDEPYPESMYEQFPGVEPEPFDEDLEESIRCWKKVAEEALRDARLYREQLTLTQDRCTELLEEVRKLRPTSPPPPGYSP